MVVTEGKSYFVFLLLVASPCVLYAEGSDEDLLRSLESGGNSDDVNEDHSNLDGALKMAREISARAPVESSEQTNLGPDIKVNARFSLFGNLFFSLHGAQVRRQMISILNKLSRPGDPTKYELWFRANPVPMIAIDRLQVVNLWARTRRIVETPQIELSVGAILASSSEDELAGLMASAMARYNDDFVKVKELDAADQKLDHWLSSFDSYKTVDMTHRDLLRKDLQAVNRMIRSGYNPWGLFRVHKKLMNWAKYAKKGQFNEALRYIFGEKHLDLQSQPIEEVRLAAIKAYIGYVSLYEKDIGSLISKETKLSPSLIAMKWRARILFELFWSPAARRVLYATSISLGGLAAAVKMGLLTTADLDAGMNAIESLWNFAVHYRAPAGLTIGAIVTGFLAVKTFNHWDDVTIFFIKLGKGVRDFGLFWFQPVKVLWTKLKLLGRTWVGQPKSAGQLAYNIALKPVVRTFQWGGRIARSGFSNLKQPVGRTFKTFGNYLSHQVRGLRASWAKPPSRYNPNDSLNLKFQALSHDMAESLSLDHNDPFFNNQARHSYFSKVNRLRQFKLALDQMRELLNSLPEEQKFLYLNATAWIFSEYRKALLNDEEFASAAFDFLSGFYLDPKDTEIVGIESNLEMNSKAPRSLLASQLQGGKIEVFFRAETFTTELQVKSEKVLRHRFLELWLVKNRRELEPWKKMILARSLLGQGFDKHIVRSDLATYVEELLPGIFRGLQDPDPKISEDALKARNKKLLQIENDMRANWLLLKPYHQSEKPFYDVNYWKLDQKQRDLDFQLKILKGSSSTQFFSFEAFLRVLWQSSGALFDEQYYSRRDELSLYAHLRQRGSNRRFDRKFGEILSALDNEFDKIAWLSYSRSIPWAEAVKPLKSDRFWETRKESEKRLGTWFVSFLENKIHSIQELNAFIENELVRRNIPLDSLVINFYELVFKHPEWIRNQDDIKTLTSREWYWPKRGAFNTKPSEVEKNVLAAMDSYAKLFPAYWAYEPSAAEAMHSQIQKIARENKIYDESFSDQMELWLRLSERGVTSTTDALFEKLMSGATEAQREQLEDEALHGRIWDQKQKALIVKRHLVKRPEYLRLITDGARLSPNKREDLLGRLIDFIKESLPERGLGFIDALESLSSDILSTEHEAALIHAAKYGSASATARAEDVGIRVLSDILNAALTWKKPAQWDFVLFIRGEIEATAFIKEQFGAVGPERIRRMFQILPLLARTQLIDSLLSSKRGLLPKVEVNSFWASTIIDHLLKNGAPKAQNVAQKILNAFLYSLREIGNGEMQSSTLAYLLSMLPSEQKNSVGEVLKNVLDVYGATGRKIAQILAVAEILDDEDAKPLLDLQDNASPPDRHFIYRDLGEILGQSKLSYDLGDLLGAASLKYAVLATDQETKKKYVLKVLRKSSVVHTNVEFRQLEELANYLIDYEGPEYGILRTIIRAAKKAVQRELQLEEEAKRSDRARELIYKRARSIPNIQFSVPKEVFVASRLLASTYAEGTSLKQLTPEFKVPVAKAILQVELENLFSDQDEIEFDPDRHQGNFRIHALSENNIKISPIDHGQVLTMTREQRSQIFDLFSLGQILKETGTTNWAAKKVVEILKLPKDMESKIFDSLKKYFGFLPKPGIKEMSAYFYVLSALDDAGLDLSIVYFDFVRSLVQLGQYRKAIEDSGLKIDESLDPKALLRREVSARVEAQLKDLHANVRSLDGIKGRKIEQKLSERARTAADCSSDLKAASGRK